MDDRPPVVADWRSEAASAALFVFITHGAAYADRMTDGPSLGVSGRAIASGLALIGIALAFQRARFLGSPVLVAADLSGGRIGPTNAVAALLAQLVGGVIGAFAARAAVTPEAIWRGGLGLPQPDLAIGPWQCVFPELMAGFIFATVILRVASRTDARSTSSSAVLRSDTGLALAAGATSAALTLILLPATGGPSVLPALSASLLLLRPVAAWPWVTGGLLGGLVAGALYRWSSAEPVRPDSPSR